MRTRVTSGYKPNFFHPFYLVRSGLYKAVKKYAGELNGSLMDFGCGTKPYIALFKNNPEYIGVDYDAGEHSHHIADTLDVYYDGKTLPFPDERFDAVFSTEVFEHVFNLDEMLPEINRVMKPGARILITCPFVWNEHEVPHDYARYTQFALRHMLEKSGFNILKIDKSGTFITAIFQMIVLYNREHLFPALGFIGRFPVTRYILKILLIFLPNLMAVVMNFILPTRKDLYNNNVILAEKK